MMIIIKNVATIINDFNTITKAVKQNPVNYTLIGYTVGNLVNIILLQDKEDSVAEPIVEVEKFLEGFFDGCGYDINVEDIESCIENEEHMLEDLMKFMEDLKGVNLNDLSSVLKVAQDLMMFIKDVIDELSPCKEASPELGMLISELKGFDIKKRLPTIMIYYT